jgi:hypothetical protein
MQVILRPNLVIDASHLWPVLRNSGSITSHWWSARLYHFMKSLDHIIGDPKRLRRIDRPNLQSKHAATVIDIRTTERWKSNVARNLSRSLQGPQGRRVRSGRSRCSYAAGRGWFMPTTKDGLRAIGKRRYGWNGVTVEVDCLDAVGHHSQSCRTQSQSTHLLFRPSCLPSLRSCISAAAAMPRLVALKRRSHAEGLLRGFTGRLQSG